MRHTKSEGSISNASTQAAYATHTYDCSARMHKYAQCKYRSGNFVYINRRVAFVSVSCRNASKCEKNINQFIKNVEYVKYVEVRCIH